MGKKSIKAHSSIQAKPSVNKKRKASERTGSAHKEKEALPYDLKIQNVVCTAWVGQKVSLREIQLVTQGRLDEAVFPSSVSRAKNPSTTNSIFDTGRILITGAQAIDKALLAAYLFVDHINKNLHLNLQVLNFKVQNIVSSFSLGYSLNIDMFYEENECFELHGTAQYDPGLFRGCSWKPLHSLVFVLFKSGRVVLTGARTWKDAEQAYKEALPYLSKYKLGEEYQVYDDTYKRTRAIDINS